MMILAQILKIMIISFAAPTFKRWRITKMHLKRPKSPKKSLKFWKLESLKMQTLAEVTLMGALKTSRTLNFWVNSLRNKKKKSRKGMKKSTKNFFKTEPLFWKETKRLGQGITHNLEEILRVLNLKENKRKHSQKIEVSHQNKRNVSYIFPNIFFSYDYQTWDSTCKC